jgi:hypothetical protein
LRNHFGIWKLITILDERIDERTRLGRAVNLTTTYSILLHTIIYLCQNGFQYQEEEGEAKGLPSMTTHWFALMRRLTKEIAM